MQNACAIVLLLLFCLTIVNCIPPLASKLLRLDRCKIVPCWLFFSPKPWTGDLLFLYRAVAPEGTKAPWRDVGWWPQRHSRAAIWNPQLRVMMALVERVSVLTDCNHFPNQEAAIRSAQYLQLLDAARARCPQAAHVQILVLHRTPGVASSDFTVLIRSAVHPTSLNEDR